MKFGASLPMYVAMIDQELSSMAMLADHSAAPCDFLVDCSHQEVIPDDTSLLFTLGNDLLNAVEYDDSHSDSFLDPELLVTVDFNTEPEHQYELLLGLDPVEDRHMFSHLLEAVLDVPEPTDDLTSDRNEDEPEPNMVVKAASKSGRITITKDKWPRLLTPGEPGYTQAFVRANVFHRTHHCSAINSEVSSGTTFCSEQSTIESQAKRCRHCTETSTDCRIATVV